MTKTKTEITKRLLGDNVPMQRIAKRLNTTRWEVYKVAFAIGHTMNGRGRPRKTKGAK